MTAKPLKKHATYDDLREVPDNFVAEMFDGELYASPRPAYPHAHAASVVAFLLGVFAAVALSLAAVGIYDQVVGGFSRYAVDGEGFAPHF